MAKRMIPRLIAKAIRCVQASNTRLATYFGERRHVLRLVANTTADRDFTVLYASLPPAMPYNGFPLPRSLGNKRELMKRILIAACFCAIGLPGVRVRAQYDPPAGYYSTATGIGPTLMAQLNDIIDGNTSIPYSGREAPLEALDQDPNNASNVILVYSGYSIPKTDFLPGVTAANTEHLWCNAYGIDSANPAYGDLFNLRPCDSDVNSARGDKYFDDVGGATPAHPESPECRTDSSRWEPRPTEKGDLARAMFYMDTRYEGDGTDGFPRNLSLTDSVGTITSTNNNFGKLATLIAWHYQDPVSTPEKKRNHKIYTDYQHNRNPYVDHPEFVWAVYGSSANDSRLYVGASEPGDGVSAVAVDLGTVIVGAPAPSQSMTLNKPGATPTTFDVTPFGDADSTSAGTGNAFVTGPQSLAVDVRLAGLASAGAKSGTITVDNTDLTSASAGQGSADGDDSINVSAIVLDHSNASFDSFLDQNSLTIDLGSAAQGSGTVMQNYSVNNLVATAGFTAKLDIDSVSGSGDTAALTTSAGPVTGIVAGSGQTFAASLDTTAAGSFSATYTLNISDENLPGDVSGTSLTLTLMGQVIACDGADANCDATVNLADIDAFVNVLLGNASPCSSCAGDVNTDGSRNGKDIQSFVASFVP